MFKTILLVVVIFYLIEIICSGSFTYIYPRIKFEAPNYSNAGKPLFITPYINNGSISLAQKLSRVSFTEKLGVKSHAGFFTVKEQPNSNLYFWYFPPVSRVVKAPVVLWLQGGPGGSSLFGLFTEIGPLLANEHGFSLRDIHWAKNYHLIFIDNPVGTGFSFTSDDEGYCNNQDCIATDLHTSLQQFFLLFPDLKDNELYLAGESYAGKYIPVLGKKIHEENKRQYSKINLRGLAMGNAYCDPVNQMEYGKYLYEHGLLDLQQKEIFESLQNKIRHQIYKKNWVKADILMDKLIDGEISNTSYFKLFTGFDNYFNILQAESSDEDMTLFSNLIKRDDIRKDIHVGYLPFNSGELVQLHLANDLLKSVAGIVAELLSYYKVLLYNGQLDIIVAYPLTEDFVRNMNFSSSEKFHESKRVVWKVDDEIAGYVKSGGNLTLVMVRNAGHMVPHDQPSWAFDMITRFITPPHFSTYVKIIGQR